MLVSRYLTYICILVRHASLGVRVCKEAGIEMVALIFFFPPSYLRVAVGYSSPTLLLNTILPFYGTALKRHFLVESRSAILPFNFDRSRIPFSLENQNSRLLPRFDSFFRFRFGRNVVRRTGVGRKWKYERIDRAYFRSLPGAGDTNGVISVCPWNSFPIGKLASMPIQ